MISQRESLTRYAWLSIFAAIITIGLKTSAYLVTDSVGLLADALESTANLLTAIVALIVLGIAWQSPDKEHAYGHSKAEYFASGVEGTLIFVAAVLIAVSVINRLINPQPLDRICLGLLVSVVAAI